MNFDQLIRKYPQAAKEWVELCRQHCDTDDELDIAVTNSYFAEKYGRLLGEGAQAYTRFVWMTDTGGPWEDEDQDE